MKSWRTTIGGILSGVAGVAAGVQLVLNHQYAAGATALAAGLAALWTGIHATDAKTMRAEVEKAVEDSRE